MTARRNVFKIGAVGILGTAGVTALPWGASVQATRASSLARRAMPQPFRCRFARPPVLGSYETTRARDGALVDHYAVTEGRGTIRVLPGGKGTSVWGYNGLIGGPTIKVRRGRRAELRIRNHLPATNPMQGNEFTTSTHLHGSASLPQYDGYASDVTPPGFYKTYHYPNLQRARTLWYHDHGVHHTADNVYSGLFAQYQLHDREEMRLLPQGDPADAAQPAGLASATRRGLRTPGRTSRLPGGDIGQTLALIVLGLGVLLLQEQLGWGLASGLLWPLMIATAALRLGSNSATHS